MRTGPGTQHGQRRCSYGQPQSFPFVQQEAHGQARSLELAVGVFFIQRVDIGSPGMVDRGHLLYW